MWRMLDIAVGNTSMRTDNDARGDAPAHGHAAVESKPSFSEAIEAATPSPA
jgi:hypothetical protein